jgi:spore coat protein U-like protein
MKKLLVSVTLALLLMAVLAVPAMAQTEEEASAPASVSVSEFVNITLSGSIDFGTLEPGDEDQGATGQTDGSPAITITVEPETNVNVDIGIKGSTTGAIALANWKYSDAFASAKTPIPAAYSAVYSAQGDGAYAFYHWITIPSDTAAGTYDATVYYKAIKTGGTF